jgi:hypothetical protein
MNALDRREPLRKKRLKASTADAIARESDGAGRIAIAASVEDLYERLLLKAAVF